MLKRDSCCCDLVWEEEKVILEYDSNLTHLSADQMRNFQSVEILFQNVRKALGVKARTYEMGAFWQKRRETVQEILYSPVSRP